MKIIVAICVVALVMGSQITTDISAKLQDFADHPYSKTLSNLVTLNMQTGSPLQDLKLLLQAIKDELIALSQFQDKEWTTTQRRNQVDLAQLTATLEQAGVDLTAQRLEQNTLLSEQTTLNNRVRDDQASLDRNTKSLSESVDRVSAENNDFTSKGADYVDAISACKEAQRLLLNMRTEGASAMIQISQETQLTLVQTRENMNRIKDLLEAHTKKSSLTLFQPIIQGLVEMSTRVDPDTLNNVLNLISRLITALQEGSDSLSSTHDTQMVNLNNLEQDLRAERGTLQSAITTGSNRLREITSRLNELDGLLTNSNAIVSVTQANLDDANTGSQRRSDEYSNQQVSVRTEIDIVDRLLEFVNERISSSQ